MDTSVISIWDLQPDAEIPSHAWTREYRQGSPKLPYPHATLYDHPEDLPLTTQIWMDVDNGLLWTSPRKVRGDDPQPDYAIRHKPNYGYDDIANSLVVRHPLTPARRALAEELLERAAPPATDYSVPAEAAAVFRRAGWTPEQVREVHTGWTIATADDARVWTTHSYQWWWRENFPRTGPHRSADVHDPRRRDELPLTPLTTADAARLLEAGVRFDAINACLHAGITDVEQILTAQPPHVPDDATRIIIGNFTALDAAAARAWLANSPGSWLKPVIAETGPRLLHINDEVFSGTWMIWSDGLLTNRGHLILPEGIEPGAQHRAWATEHFTEPGFVVTTPLIKTLLAARNLADLTPQLWMPWQEATGLTSTTVEKHTQDIAVGPHTTIDSQVALTSHTVTLPTGEATVWEVSDSLGLDSLGQGRYTERWIHTDLNAATALYQQIVAVQPPIATVEQLSGMLGVTGNAITQAIRRDRATPWREQAAPRRPESMHRNGRAELFPTRRFLLWWSARVGHGPGRGRRAGQ
ncbi:hypothetical protein [Streptosporangium sp. CA-115845]|uniref:hypothetical protein n=1 Tax=Streptosporangium sp. CA-115845 TaxID=3240071 RepID=UPI003D929292